MFFVSFLYIITYSLFFGGSARENSFFTVVDLRWDAVQTVVQTLFWWCCDKIMKKAAMTTKPGIVIKLDKDYIMPMNEVMQIHGVRF